MDALEILLSHRSERSFKPDPIPESLLGQVLRAGWLGPTSINTQQVSLVLVQDPGRRARLAEIAGGQRWVAQAPVFITVVADLHKTALGVARAGKTQAVQNTAEGFLSAVQDCGITLGRLMVAAQALGLGCVPIGGIRRDPSAVVELLGLPPLTFPVNGLSLGYVEKPAAQKPRLDMKTYCHPERYQTQGLEEALAEYDQALVDHWVAIGRQGGEPWSASIAAAYDKPYYPKVLAALKAQGFTLEQ